MNQGVVSILTIMASIFNVTSFYFAFGEKPSKMKLFGMLFCVGTSVCLAIKAVQVGNEKLENSNGEVIEDDGNKTLYGFYSLCFAIIVPVGFSLKHFFIRKYKVDYRTLDLVVDSSITENIIFCIWTLIQYGINGIIVEDLWLGGLIGFMRCIGNSFMGLGIAFG